MSTSEARRDANRENAEHSTGPRSHAGKQRTRLNGLRHGLTGQTVVMPDEDRQVYEAFITQTIADLEPANDTERALAQSIADECWRLNRARAIEGNIFALAEFTAPAAPVEYDAVESALNQAQTYLDHAREIQLLSVYAGRITRGIARTKAELTALQAERRKACAQALEEALLLVRLAEANGESYNPAAEFSHHGFAFSTAELTRLLHRNRRLDEARQLVKSASHRLRKAA